MKLVLFAIVFANVLFLASCNSSDNDSDKIQQTSILSSQVTLKSENSCDALKQKFIDNWLENLLSPRRYFPLAVDDFVLNTIDGVENGVAEGVADADATPQPTNVSQTNTQEEGVDEADKVKADSHGNIYIAQHDKLIIADAFPPQEMDISATLSLDGFVRGLYLAEQENLLVALVVPLQPVIAQELLVGPYFSINPVTDLVIIDISNPAEPAIQKRIRFDGHLVSSRRIDSRLHLVQTYYLDRHGLFQNEDISTLLDDFYQAFVEENSELQEQIKQQLRQLIETELNNIDVATLLPGYEVLEGAETMNSKLVSCEDVYLPQVDLQSNHLLTLSSLDINGDNIDQLAAVGRGWITYVSLQDLYIVQPGNFWWWGQNQNQQSAIHHFSISDQKPVYRSTGLVSGYVNNAFSLSFYQDMLRVVTTENLWNLSDRSDIRSTNHLFILQDTDDAGMDIVGSIKNYADNERIFSARFLNEKAFVVTFRQVDPLFSFDLSDPENPFIAGELKIPGFSTYMHPIDETHLLTVGRDGTEDGATDNVSVKLFDISNLASPTLVDSYTPTLGEGYSWSQAGWDHHAFTYYASEKLLSIPVSSYNFEDDDYFMGLLVLEVDTEKGLDLAGRIDHEDLLNDITCNVTDFICDPYYYRWLSQPERSIFMSDENDSYLYSLSNIGLKAVNTKSMDVTEGSLLLPPSEPFYGLYVVE